MKIENPGFQITLGKGFQMRFANGWTVSVQWGGGNYCENYHDQINSIVGAVEGWAASGAKGCKDAEIAAWDGNGNWLKLGNDTVQGRCSPDEVAKFIAKIARKKAAAPKTVKV